MLVKSSLGWFLTLAAPHKNKKAAARKPRSSEGSVGSGTTCFLTWRESSGYSTDSSASDYSALEQQKIIPAFVSHQ